MKHYFLSSILGITILTCSCEKNSSDTAMISESSKQKPLVAVIPLIDNSEHALAWNLSDEITYTLCTSLDKQNKMNLALPGKIRSQVRKMKSHYNPFGEDLGWVKQTFNDEEFVVFLEMLEHSEVPNEGSKKTTPDLLSAHLNLALRLRIIDNRGESPSIVLQEILQDSHFVPRQFTQYNFHQSPWNTEEFSLSPVGIAHAQLIKEIKGRIEDYILLAKNR